jgi:hypothetical protein
MTYSELIKNNGASTTAKALEQRARRMARRKGLYVRKFRFPQHYAGAYQEYWCDNQLFENVAELTDYLAEK